MKGFQETVEKHQEVAHQQAEKQQQISEAQEKCLDQIQQHSTDVQNVLDKAVAQMEALSDLANKINGVSEEQQRLLVDSTKTAVQDILDAVKQIYGANESFMTSAKTQTEQMNLTMQTQTAEMKKIVDDFAVSAHAQVDQLSAGVQKQADRMQEISEAYAASTKE